MAVLHTIASSGDDGAEDGDVSDDGEFDTLEHSGQIDPSSDELEIPETKSIAAAAAFAAADAHLLFLRARCTAPLLRSHRSRPDRGALS